MRATFTFDWTKVNKKPKMVNLASFYKTEACGQTVLPDTSILIQELVENAKIQKRYFADFQTMYNLSHHILFEFSRQK